MFPNKLKIARIVPVHKKDNSSVIHNYRPISVLPALSKIFEKIMHMQLNSYFKSLNLIYPIDMDLENTIVQNMQP